MANIIQEPNEENNNSHELRSTNSAFFTKREQAIEYFNKAIESCHDYFEEHAQELINFSTFNTRAENVLKRANIFTLGALAEQTGEQLLKQKNLGIDTLYNIADGCRRLPDLKPESQNEIKAPTYDPKEFWIALQEKSKRILDSADDLPDDWDKLESATKLYGKLAEIFIDCISDEAYKIEERDRQCLIHHILMRETLAVLGERYEISRERVRQIIKKRFKYFIFRFLRGKYVDNAYRQSFLDALMSIPNEEYPSCLTNIKQKSSFIWDWVRTIATGKYQSGFLDDKIDLLLKEHEKRRVREKEIQRQKKIEEKKAKSQIEIIEIDHYPEFVDIYKDGYMWAVKGDSALILHNLLGYKLYYVDNMAHTGGPNLQKIEDALEEAGIKYRVHKNIYTTVQKF